MAGGLTISTLNDSSGVLATQNGMSGIAKAWVNFNGTTTPPTIRASFNVSSVTRIGTGEYTVNFTTAMPDANYMLVAGCEYTVGSGLLTVTERYSDVPATASSVYVINYQEAGGAIDRTYVDVAIFR
jgi:hypothetical protein